MSTSNISILERSLLKEFFHETSFVECLQKPIMNTNASEGDLKKLQKEHDAKRYNTPPLASSTFVDSSKRMSGAKPKTVLTSKNSSLQKKMEKYAQTSMQRPVSMAQASVQVNERSLMRGADASYVGSSATPSSFEYFGSHSSRSNTNSEISHTTDKEYKISRRKKPVKSSDQEIHPFVAEINEMICDKRNALKEKQVKASSIEIDSQAKLKKLHDTIQRVMEENKENTTANSSSSMMAPSPQLDLGIQLLCSLIDAKSLNQKQKKQLVRDIVKRLTLMPSSDGAYSSALVSEQSTISSKSKSEIVTDGSIEQCSRKNSQTAIGSQQPIKVSNKVVRNSHDKDQNIKGKI